MVENTNLRTRRSLRSTAATLLFWIVFMWIFTGKAVWLPLAFLIVGSDLKELAQVIIDPAGDRIGGRYAVRPVCLTSVSLSSPVSARLTILILWIRWKLFSDTGEDFGFISAILRTLSVSRLLWHWSCRDKLFGWTIFFWAALTAYTRVYLGVHFISDIVPEPFRVCSSVIWSQALFFQPFEVASVQVNKREPLYSKKRIRLICHCNICDDPDYYRF